MGAQLALVPRVAAAEGRLDWLAVVGEVEVRLGGVEVFSRERADRAAGVAADLIVEARLAEAADAAVLAVAELRVLTGLRVRVSGAALVVLVEGLVVRRARAGVVIAPWPRTTAGSRR